MRYRSLPREHDFDKWTISNVFVNEINGHGSSKLKLVGLKVRIKFSLDEVEEVCVVVLAPQVERFLCEGMHGDGSIQNGRDGLVAGLWEMQQKGDLVELVIEPAVLYAELLPLLAPGNKTFPH